MDRYYGLNTGTCYLGPSWSLIFSAPRGYPEAKFEPNSYGFRPGRGCHDAIQAIFNFTRLKPKFVLDADIEKCFDSIDHDKLMTKLSTLPAIANLIRGWLKAGILENGEILSSEAGTPNLTITHECGPPRT
jgi:retron-type reverse transcriptase